MNIEYVYDKFMGREVRHFDKIHFKEG